MIGQLIIGMMVGGLFVGTIIAVATALVAMVPARWKAWLRC